MKTLAHEGSAARAGALAKLASACEHAAAALDHLMASELRQAVTAASQSHPALGEGGGGDDGDGAEEEVVTSQATAAEQERPQGAITPMEVEMAAVPGGFRQQQGGGRGAARAPQHVRSAPGACSSGRPAMVAAAVTAGCRALSSWAPRRVAPPRSGEPLLSSHRAAPPCPRPRGRGLYACLPELSCLLRRRG
eukprot:SAG25_NODE_291_length_10320_cov_2.259219_4_plen_193_part_00